MVFPKDGVTRCGIRYSKPRDKDNNCDKEKKNRASPRSNNIDGKKSTIRVEQNNVLFELQSCVSILVTCTLSTLLMSCIALVYYRLCVKSNGKIVLSFSFR